MMLIENVNLKFRCKEDLNAMPNCSSGKYCSSCKQTVVDFREKDAFQLSTILMKNQEVCGIFSKEQLNVGGNSNKKHTNIYKRYAIGILVYLGITIFTKDSFAQQSSPKDTLITKTDNAVFGGVAEILPQYKKGGAEAMVKFIQQNIIYPKDAKKGKVYVSFIIGTNGKVYEPKIVRGISEVADKEALRIVKLLEFNPGIQNGELKSYSYSLPIFFNMETKK